MTSWSRYIDEHGTPRQHGEIGYQPLGNHAHGLLEENNYAGDAAAVIRRRLFDLGHRYSEELTSFEDWHLYRRTRPRRTPRNDHPPNASCATASTPNKCKPASRSPTAPASKKRSTPTSTKMGRAGPPRRCRRSPTETMRVAFVSRELYPLRLGGIGQFVSAAASLLAEVAEVTVLTSSNVEPVYRSLLAEGDSRLPPAGVRVEFVEEPSEEEALGWSCLMHCYSARVLERLRELYPDGGPELIEFPDFLGEGL